jgi:glyoxylase-like metal-dependent hydrolase (beta-lactamase superfamily II)
VGEEVADAVRAGRLGVDAERLPPLEVGPQEAGLALEAVEDLLAHTITHDGRPVAEPAVPGQFILSREQQFLIRDEEPLLFHTGLRGSFASVKEAIGRVLPVEKLRYVAFSHVEADECGALSHFLEAAPGAVPVCSRVAAMVSVNDLADRPPRPMADGEKLLAALVDVLAATP